MNAYRKARGLNHFYLPLPPDKMLAEIKQFSPSVRLSETLLEDTCDLPCSKGMGFSPTVLALLSLIYDNLVVGVLLSALTPDS